MNKAVQTDSDLISGGRWAVGFRQINCLHSH